MRHVFFLRLAPLLTLAIVVSTSLAQTTQPAIDTHMRSPADEIATIVLPPGYHLELVASEPDVVCPVVCAWDGNGRMFVAEMRSYMLDLNGSKAHTRISRVSRWESTRGDGVYDKHTVYADNLLLPRMILPLDDRVLIRETDTKDIVSYRDTHGDGVADEKIKVYDGGVQEGNLEHQPSGLLWDIDNWIYVTAQNERFRFTHGKFEKASLPFRPGQWGIAMDDTGRLIFNSAGGERPAHNFQVMPQYGDIDLSNELTPDFTRVYPIEHLTDVEGGPTRLYPGGGLNRFSGCAGPCVFRGDALPADLYGDYILPEPVGRLIRRAKVANVGGKLVLSNAYDQKEFIASTDANFRPVWSATGPDGCLYICDMYHGIIQEANWTKIGSYLRPQIKKYNLQDHKNAGRIFRLVYDGMKPRPLPHMLDESPQQLVDHLADPNGWWRDTAQKLIVLKHDLSVVPALDALASTSTNPIARLHGYWTLDGLDALDTRTALKAMHDSDARVRAAAIRMVEPRLADATLRQAVVGLATSDDSAVVAQACLSLLADHSASADPVVDDALKRQSQTAFSTEAVTAYRSNIAKAKAEEEHRLAMIKKDPVLAAMMDKGRLGYEQTCIACHGWNGLGTPAPEHDGSTIAPPLRGSRHLLADREQVCRIVLCGLTGPNYGKNFPGQMAGFKWATDDSLASILTYARNNWGNKGDPIGASDVTDARKATALRAGPFTVPELFGSDRPMINIGRSAGDVVLDPARAELHGDGLRLQMYPGTLNIGFWDDAKSSISWTAPVMTAGTFKVIAFTASQDGSSTITADVGGQAMSAMCPPTGGWDRFCPVAVGEVTVRVPGDVKIELKPAVDSPWRATNLAGVVLTPVEQIDVPKR